MDAQLPTTGQRDESSSPGANPPPAHPHCPSSPTPASHLGTAGIWLCLYFTLSPPLCGGGLCLSRITYTDMPFLKDFFPVEKTQVKWKECNSKEAAEVALR